MTRSKEYHKNCPHCGAEDMDGSLQIIKKPALRFHVFCSCCGAQGPESDSHEEAWLDWDVRFTATTHCAMCGKFVSRGMGFCSDDCQRNAHQQQMTEDARAAGF